MVAAYKQGFRWRPAAYPVPMTEPTAVPTSMLPSTPRYVTVPSEPYTATGAGLDSIQWTPTADTPALPWGTAPVSTLPTSAPRTYWKFDSRLDLRKSKIYAVPSLSTSVSTSQSKPEPPLQPAPLRPPAPTVPAVTVTPVQVVGVPGSTHAGINTVSFVVTTLWGFTLIGANCIFYLINFLFIVP